MSSSWRKFIAPAAYVQGPDALSTSGDAYTHLRGSTAYILGGETALSITDERITTGLDGADIDIAEVSSGVERCTADAIERHTDRASRGSADIIIGVGGGVAIDVATAVAIEMNSELVTIPTVASTDAPTSTIAVVYDENDTFVEARLRDRNPELVLVDTSVIAEAPSKSLRHGMGDALATRFEAEAAMDANVVVRAGGRSSHAALAIANLAYERVAEYGPLALKACDRNAVTPAFEKVVEANTLLSGLGFESSGTAGAHAIQVGLTNAGYREPHGVLVAFGTLAEIILQDREPALIEEVRSVYRSIGLDGAIDGIELREQRLRRAGEIALESGMEAEPYPVTAEEIAGAIRTAYDLNASTSA